jgi:cation diffusion facilitator family transporter
MAESTTAVYAALAGNAAVAITKLTAAAFTGSSAMLSEGIHSVVDTADQALLLLGKRRSARPADEDHPFGYGQELYFWTLIVALVIFAAGGAVSAYEGVVRLLEPSAPETSIWNYVVLGLAVVFEGTSLAIALRQFRSLYPDQPFFTVVRRSKDPTIFTVVFEDTAALIGLAIAFCGVYLSGRTGNPVYDSVASILIGVLLMLVAIVLVRESRGLLTGEAADPEIQRSIREVLTSDADVTAASRPLTMYFGPESILLLAEIQFRSGLEAGQVSEAVDRLESAVRGRWPKVKRIFIEAAAIGEPRN